MSNSNIPQHGFSNLEFEERVSKAQKIMHKQQLDAIFVTTPLYEFPTLNLLSAPFQGSSCSCLTPKLNL